MNLYYLKISLFVLLSIFSLNTVFISKESIAKEPIEPLPINPDYDQAKARIGKLLFSDPLLSSNKTIACVSCHIINQNGADSRDVSLGVNNAKGNIQSPTVLNARYNFKQFWNGRADSLLEQASGPIHNPVEMASDAKEVEKRINADKNYQKLFSEIGYTGKITFAMVLEAIVEFEKALVTPNSRFDRFLRGEIQLTAQEIEGYQNFKELGCITCHNGINIGGNSFQKIGMFNPYPFKEQYPDRYAITKEDGHKNVFKVPSLRNIALTAPYFHDASAKTLIQAVQTMGYHNLGFQLSTQQIQLLVAFLNTLTGETPAILQ